MLGFAALTRKFYDDVLGKTKLGRNLPTRQPNPTSNITSLVVSCSAVLITSTTLQTMLVLRRPIVSLAVLSSFRSTSSFVLRQPSVLVAAASSTSRTSLSHPTSRSLSSTSENDHDNDTTMTSKEEEYVPPKVWKWDAENGGKFSKTNRPIAGSTHDKELPVGKHPIQVYSQATPNGVKVTVLLEELLEAGVKEAEYDAWLTSIFVGEQFSSGFVAANPNSKIPALMDHGATKDKDQEPLRVFESGSILMYLADKFEKFIPPTTSIRERTECINWLMWQMGSAPYVGGGFGHFYAYAPSKMQYPIDRFTMETKRQMDVLDQHLAKSKYMVGDEYTIADIAIWSWYGQIALDNLYDNAYEFLDMKSYEHVIRWAREIAERPAVKRGKMVNKNWGPPEEQLWNRHSAEDFEKEIQSKKQEGSEE